mmetsp:Transcript_13418/g.16285  ORF Transcript_13418/g.16285 Transcript_13418/m.16285 type:complete len:121 (-) Transcript_13418:2052-2414(-)
MSSPNQKAYKETINVSDAKERTKEPTEVHIVPNGAGPFDNQHYDQKQHHVSDTISQAGDLLMTPLKKNDNQDTLHSSKMGETEALAGAYPVERDQQVIVPLLLALFVILSPFKSAGRNKI